MFDKEITVYYFNGKWNVMDYFSMKQIESFKHFMQFIANQ